MVFKDQAIALLALEGYCEEIFFGGELDFDYRDPLPGVFQLAIKCPVVSGKLSRLKPFLAGSKISSVLDQILVEGDLSATGKGMKLHLNFSPMIINLKQKCKEP